MVIALDADDARGAVAHEIVRDAIAAALELHRRHVGAVEPPERMHPAVLDEVLSRRERPAVAADDFGGAAAERVQVAAQDAVCAAAGHPDARAGEAFQGASGNEAPLAVPDQHAARSRQVEHQAFDRTWATFASDSIGTVSRPISTVAWAGSEGG